MVPAPLPEVTEAQEGLGDARASSKLPVLQQPGGVTSLQPCAACRGKLVPELGACCLLEEFPCPRSSRPRARCCFPPPLPAQSPRAQAVS